MARKRHKPEEIVAKLRQADVLISRGKPVADAVRAIGVTKVMMLRGFAQQKGKAVLMASHDPKARDFADSVYGLVDGRIAGLNA